jgi:Arf-GAP with SH3 domain, ANK repeat and PH domain-containing protein
VKESSLITEDHPRVPASPKIPSPHLDVASSHKLRVPSAQSVDSRISDSDGETVVESLREPKSPSFEPIPENGLGLVPTMTNTTSSTTPMKVDLARQPQENDVSRVEDGPLFRATLKSMEQRTGSMRARWKKVLKRAQEALEAQRARNNSEAALIQSFQEASSSNANAVQPAIDHYFNKIAKEILAFEKQNVENLQKMVIDPIQKLYSYDIKQAETKKRDFDEESKEFYSYVGRYLGQRQDSMKEKKRAETDSKYQSKRRNFELKRFDYSSFMQDLHGGRKDQEVLSHLTRYADAQAKGYLNTAKRIESMLPQLEALSSEVKDLDKEFQFQRTEREEKRRALEKSSAPFGEVDTVAAIQGQAAAPSTVGGRPASVGDLDSVTRGNGLVISPGQIGSVSGPSGQAALVQPGSSLPAHSPSQKFKGFRDLEEKDYSTMAAADSAGALHRKEGLLWALSRPGSHVDPKGLNKQAWHKCVSNLPRY